MNRKITSKSHEIRYKAYSAGQTVPSTAQIRGEGNNTKCVGKKRFNGSVTFSPSHFGQGHISTFRGSSDFIFYPKPYI
jgi:hypothetical protein